jgi:hypothetical protein
MSTKNNAVGGLEICLEWRRVFFSRFAGDVGKCVQMVSWMAGFLLGKNAD